MKTFFQGVQLLGTTATYLDGITVPFSTDLDTWHKTITDTTFAESIESLPAKFLPRVADFNGTDDYILLNSAIVMNDFDITIEFITGSNITTDKNILDTAAASLARIFISLGTLFVELDLNGDIVNFTANTLTINTHYIARFLRVGTSCTLTLNDFTPEIKIFPTGTGTLTIDRISGSGARWFLGKIISLIMDDNLNMRLSGQGDYEYNLSGNANHGTWAGTGGRYTYDLEGSDYSNVNGYSLWEHATSDDIQVSFDTDGNALSLTPGTNIPTGYTKTRDVLAGGTKWNMQDALIDFDPDDGTDAAIAILDRSNATYQTATSRAADNYDAANPYRYQVNEIADPRIYDTYFEAAYKDRIFGKVILDGTDLIRYDEVLNYGTVKAGSNLVTVQEYCGIDGIYP
jgi:hypothetical protein